MGCDIHMYVEKKVKGIGWVRWQRTDVEKHGEYSYVRDYYAYSKRNYRLFSILAGVRSEDRSVGPIVQPRGIPHDASREVKAEFELWDADGHSHSFLTLEELLKYDWSKPIKHQGLVEAEVYDAWKASDELWPSMWCKGASFGTKVTEQEYTEMKGRELPSEKPLFIHAEWETTAADSAREFYDTYLPRLQKLAGKNPKNVRLVFWFDN
jgi:hypothetical protein